MNELNKISRQCFKTIGCSDERKNEEKMMLRRLQEVVAVVAKKRLGNDALEEN